MGLKSLQNVWERLAQQDPMWAVVSDPEFRDGGWDVEEFFTTGAAVADNVMAHLGSLGLPERRERCLDFGCGPGRVTQAFCAYFDHCHGIDIAPTMIELARRFNRFGDRVRYDVNDRGDLGMFPDATFDLVHSCIVLQHIEPLYTKEYLREFLRVTRPGGTVVFQLPSHPRPAAPATPLPDGAFKARIELAEPAPPRLSTDEVLTLSVRVTNLGDAVWPAHTEGDVGYHLRLGNHWLTSGGKIAVVDDGRSQLPVDLEPGSSGVMSLRVRAPARPGFYVLELDLVQEAVTWFSRRGSETLQVPVMVEGSRRRAPVAGALVSRLRHSSIMPTVVRIMPKVMRKAIRVARTWGPTDPPPDAAPDPGAGHDPGFEMHSVPHDEVVEVLQAAGGRIVAYHEDPYAGPEWVSYLYFVAREAVRQPDH